MNIADELRKLQELHRSGGLNDEEFARAKRAVLERAEGDAPATDVVQEQLDHLRQQTELLQLDQAWERERKQYVGTSEAGVEIVPSRAGGVAGAAACIALGVIGMVGLAAMGAGLWALFGLVIVAIGLWAGIGIYSKAGEYERAEARYQQRRREVLDRGLAPPGPAARPRDDRITGG